VKVMGRFCAEAVDGAMNARAASKNAVRAVVVRREGEAMRLLERKRPCE
jgi:hypothetical protein